jgi:hypothetical protein
MESSDLDIEVLQSTQSPIDSVVYRALRPDEMFTLMSTGYLSAPCNVCAGNQNPCCTITPAAHVNSGSRAVLKSRWISTTKDLNIAALWACRKGNITITTEAAPGRASGIIAVIHPDGLNYIDPTELPTIGITAKNAAIASKEILLGDKIPWDNIIGLYQAIQVNKDEYDRYNGMKVYGNKTKNGASSYVVILDGIKQTDDKFLEVLKNAAKVGLENRFGPGVVAGSKKVKKGKKTKKNKHRKVFSNK